MTTTNKLTVAFLVLVMIASAVATAWSIGADRPADGFSGRPGILLGDGASRKAGSTAADWVTNADHVVAVSVASETERPPTASEVARGEGLIFRDLVLRVDTVIWSSDVAARPAPTTVDWVAFGWQFVGGDLDDRVRVGAHDAPRFERGHSYVLALEWVPGCGDSAGSWEGLSPSATAPYDDGVIGSGELEGSVVEAASPRTDRSGGADLRDRVAGRGAAALAAELRAARPRAAERQDRVRVRTAAEARC